MRKAPTRSENRLWSWLRDRRFGSYKFRRQHPVAGYILDFYCAKLKLAIEVDGSHHYSVNDEYDAARSLVLQHHGIEVLRIPNELFMQDHVLVIDMIQAAIDHRR